MFVHADVAVVGTGFAGSLLALTLARQGRKVILFDRVRHPRFAVGESSTPIADLLLRTLARRYDLPRIGRLSRYGTWRKAYPQLTCGRKRGFSYFFQRPHTQFESLPDNALLVAASSASDELSDTHWYRSEVDQFFVQEAEQGGVLCVEGVQPTLSECPGGWRLRTDLPFPAEYQSPFVVDASGGGGFLAAELAIPQQVTNLHTRSSAIFGHWMDVTRWTDMLTRYHLDTTEFPFCCDDAALHHVLDEGWMWQLRFDNGITSCGILLEEMSGQVAQASAEEVWDSVLQRYPSLSEQFHAACCLAPRGELRRALRVQRMSERMTGPNWAMLPNTAGFLDPLHSSGIAQSLCGVERLARLLGQPTDEAALQAGLRHYEQTLRREFELLDLLISGCYRTRRCPRLFIAFSMLYFAAATTFERRMRDEQLADGAAFLGADDAEWMAVVRRLWQRASELARTEPTESEVAVYESELAEAISPYNHVGLCDPAAANMYRYTAIELGDW